MAWWDDVAGAVGDAAGQIFGNDSQDIIIPSNPTQSQTQSQTNFDPNLEDRITIDQLGAIAGGNTTNTQNSESLVNRVASILGDRVQAIGLVSAANSGNSNAISILASMGIEPYASFVAGSSSGGSSGSGGSGRVLYPEEIAQIRAQTDEVLANIGNINARTGQTNAQTRQIQSLFDPNYPDGALVPLPDGTSRINGTEIIIDTRQKGAFKPVANAPGYLVDPVTGTVIDTNGNQIARQQLQETIRSNQAREGLTQAQINADVENNRNRLALDTTLGVGGLNLDAAKAENDFALKNGLGTNQLNLDSFLGTGNLNVNATNAETNRLSALTNRTSNAGSLAARQQELQDARTQNIIALSANPQNFVQREYETRALIAPPGYNGPAYRDNPALNQAISQLLTTPNVDNILPTYQAPHFDPVALPNASLPRVTAPSYTQLNTTANIPAPVQRDINGDPYTAPVTAANKPASDHFRNIGVPARFLAPLGYAHGTKGTKEDEFIVGDPQIDGEPNPELVRIHNPGPDTTAEVVPFKSMFDSIMQLFNMNTQNPQPEMVFNDDIPLDTSQIDDQRGRKMNQSLVTKNINTKATATPEPVPSSSLQGDVTMGREMDAQSNQMGGLGKLFADILISIANQWGQNGGLAQYAYGTDFGQNDGFNSFRNFFDNSNFRNFMNGYTNPNGNDNPNTPTQGNNNSGSNPNSTPSIQPATPPAGGNSQPVNNNNSGYAVNPALFGPRDSAGNFLGVLTANSNEAIQNMPNVQYAQNYQNQNAYNQLGVGPVNAAFGVNLPDVGGLNLRQLNDIALDPDAWGTLSSLYASGNRNLQAIYNRVLANAPIGNAINSLSAIRTR